MFSFRSASKNHLKEPALPGVDIHSHLLPGVDDGAVNTADGVYLVRELMNLGFRKAITTPHIYKGLYANNRQSIQQSFTRLQDELKLKQVSFALEYAAEYFFDEDFFQNISSGDVLTFGNRYVLFELPMMMKPPMLEEVVFKMNLAGYIPVLAHPERYSYFHERSMRGYSLLREMGVLFQLNLMSVTGHYGHEIEKAASGLITHGFVDLVGTDLHRGKQVAVVEEALHHRLIHQLVDSGKLLNHTI